MKKYNFVFILLVMFLTVSCLDYLDQAPEAGLTQDEVFSKYDNFRLFFDAVYDGTSYDPQARLADFNIKTSYSLYFSRSDLRHTWESLTETADMGRIQRQVIKLGQIESNLHWFTTHRVAPILKSMFIVIRICNMTLENIHKLKNVDTKVIDDFKAQAYFVRAYSHFALFRMFGRMPYINHTIGPDDQWDMVRLSNHATLINIAADLDTAYLYFEKAGKIRRDPGPGLPGHLNDPDQWRPNGVAAKALKGRVLLYAASPLSNELGKTDWEEAAKANWEAIKLAEQYEYDLLSLADYKDNFVGAKYSNEQIWAWNLGPATYSHAIHTQLINGVFRGTTGATGENPTQNMVDRFETAWGDPLYSATERQAAEALGHYSEQNPYVNRDPRLDIVVIYNTQNVTGYGPAQIYYEMVNGIPEYGELLNQSFPGITQTGYYQRKIWGEQSVKNRITSNYTDPLIRLTELYLNYAEAANEAYGPSVPAPGSTMSAVDAINKIRNRVGMVPVQNRFTTSSEVFQERIKNERAVELYGEGHRFFDIRRWKDAPVLMSTPLQGVDIEKVPVSPDYPTGFKYTRKILPANRQVAWLSDAQYYFPFPIEEENKMFNFQPNPRW